MVGGGSAMRAALDPKWFIVLKLPAIFEDVLQENRKNFKLFFQ